MQTTAPFEEPERRGVAWLTVARVAKRFGYSNAYIRGLARDGTIIAKKGKRSWRLDPVSTRKWGKPFEKKEDE